MKDLQINAVREYLQNGNTITQLEALYKFNSLRLSAIIFKLRKEGMNIATETVHDDNTGKNYGRYYLVVEER